MRSSIGFSLLATGIAVLPSVAAAQSLLSALATISSLINAAIIIIIGVAIVVFFWGLVEYLTEAGEKKSAGLQTMLYGILAIAVMVSVWGLVRLLQNTFGVGNQTPIVPSTIQALPGFAPVR